MKYLMLLLFCCAFSFAQSQDLDAKYGEKVSSVDSIIYNLYDVISGDKGEKRDWDLFRYLFRDDAKLIPVVSDSLGNSIPLYWTADDYVTRSGAYLENNGFVEHEIYRVQERFGDIVHMFSTYEGFRSRADEEPFVRGINSIQLVFDSNRWWVVNIFWQAESEKYPLPELYLPK